MGLDTAMRLASRGIGVTIIGRSEDKLQAAGAEIQAAGAPEVNHQTLDLYDQAAVDHFIESINSGETTSFDFLVNSAGSFLPTPFLEHTRENYHQYHDLNAAFFFITQAVARQMTAKGIHGSIVNIGSMSAKQAIKATPSSAYSMAKAG